MKKTFALVLAVAMVMSLAAVAFAAPITNTSDTKNNKALALAGPFRYDGDLDSGKGGVKGGIVQYGKAAYWQLLYNKYNSASKKYDGDSVAVTDYKDVEKLKVKAKWEMGSDLVDGLSIVKKRVAAETKTVDSKKVYKEDGVFAADNTAVPADFVAPTTGGYAYFLELKTKVKDATSDADIVGTLTFNKKKSDDSAIEFDDAELDITLNVFFENNWLTGAVNYLIDDSFTSKMKPETKYLLKFDSDEEVDLEFGLGQNEGTFTVDVSGQGKVMLEFNTKADDALVAANPGAKMFFVNFNNTKFNRTGEFAYETEDLQYVYEIKDGKLVSIPSAEYDESDETIYFNTRVLGAYVFSDVELVDAPAAVEAPVVDAPVENPGTGAAA